MMSLIHFGTGKVYPQIAQIPQISECKAGSGQINGCWFTGTQSATPPSSARKNDRILKNSVRTKAVSRLRLATAVQDDSGFTRIHQRKESDPICAVSFASPGENCGLT
jgi:hypothetical protein